MQNSIMQTKLFSTALGGAPLAAGIAAHAVMPALAQSQSQAAMIATHLFVKRDMAERLEPSGTSVSRVMLTANQANGRFRIIDEIFKPGMKTPPHRHAYHSETCVVLSGKLQWTVAGKTDVIGPGDLVFIPPDTSHATEIAGDEPVHAIMLYERGGYDIALRQRAAARHKAWAIAHGRLGRKHFDPRP